MENKAPRTYKKKVYKTKGKSFKFTEKFNEILEKVSEKYGMSQTDLIEYLVMRENDKID